jgi:hypothetical protein
MREINVKVKNNELDALENYLMIKLSKKEKKKAKKRCIKLWGKLVREYDKD